jgi:hypothetical protein
VGLSHLVDQAGFRMGEREHQPGCESLGVVDLASPAAQCPWADADRLGKQGPGHAVEVAGLCIPDGILAGSSSLSLGESASCLPQRVQADDLGAAEQPASRSGCHGL